MKIVCFGDSITKGQFGYNWVRQLEHEIGQQGFQFFNFGVNGNTAFCALQRIKNVIDIQPDKIFILLGTNDVNAVMSEKNTKSYIKRAKLPQRPNLSWYLENMQTIINQFKTHTKAKIYIITLPILGENLNDKANQTILAYNTKLIQLCEQSQVNVLHLHQEMLAHYTKNPPKKVVAYHDRLGFDCKSIFTILHFAPRLGFY